MPAWTHGALTRCLREGGFSAPNIISQWRKRGWLAGRNGYVSHRQLGSSDGFRHIDAGALPPDVAAAVLRD